MIQLITVPVTANSVALVTHQIKFAHRLRAAYVESTDAGGATAKILRVIAADPGNIAIWRSSTPTIPAAQSLFACFGVGMSHGLGTDAISAATYAQSSLPNIWIDQDTQLSFEILTAEAATFIQRVVLFVESHDRG